MKDFLAHVRDELVAPHLQQLKEAAKVKQENRNKRQADLQYERREKKRKTGVAAMVGPTIRLTPNRDQMLANLYLAIKSGN